MTLETRFALTVMAGAAMRARRQEHSIHEPNPWEGLALWAERWIPLPAWPCFACCRGRAV